MWPNINVFKKCGKSVHMAHILWHELALELFQHQLLLGCSDISKHIWQSIYKYVGVFEVFL